MNGEKTIQAILRDHLAVITCVNDPQPNENTVIDPELIKVIIQDFLDWGGNSGRRPCYYDEEDNVIRDGIKFRL